MEKSDISKSREEPPMQPNLKFFLRTLMGTEGGALRQPGTTSTPDLNIQKTQTLRIITYADILALLIAQTPSLTHHRVSKMEEGNL